MQVHAADPSYLQSKVSFSKICGTGMPPVSPPTGCSARQLRKIVVGVGISKANYLRFVTKLLSNNFVLLGKH